MKYKVYMATLLTAALLAAEGGIVTAQGAERTVKTTVRRVVVPEHSRRFLLASAKRLQADDVPIVKSMAESSEEIEDSSALLYKEEAREAGIIGVLPDGAFETLLTNGNYRVGYDIPAGTYHINTVHGSGAVTVVKTDLHYGYRVLRDSYQFVMPPALNMESICSDEVRIYERKADPVLSEEENVQITKEDLLDNVQAAACKAGLSEALGWELTEGTVIQVRGDLILKMHNAQPDIMAFCRRVQDLDGSILFDAGRYMAGVDFPEAVYDVVGAGSDAVIEINAGESGEHFRITKEPKDEMDAVVFRNLMFADGTILITDEKIKLIPKVRVPYGR